MRRAGKFKSLKTGALAIRNKPSNSRYNQRNAPRFTNRVNQQIRAREVRVVDGVTGAQLGIMRTQDALNLARNRGLDLVEVAAQADPPVCRIVDYGKFRYQQAKQEKERKAVAARTASKVKELKLRVNIDDHDYMIKMRRSEQFLCDGDKLRVQLMFRGRELAHQELGYDLMLRVIADLKQVAVVEMEPKKMGRNINMTLAPLPPNKRKPKFQHVDRDEEDDEDEDFTDVDEDAPHDEDDSAEDHEEGEDHDEGDASQDGDEPAPESK